MTRSTPMTDHPPEDPPEGDTLVGLPPLMGVPEVARLLGISENTLWKMLRRGACPIPHFKMGRLVKFRSADVGRFLRGEAET